MLTTALAYKLILVGASFAAARLTWLSFPGAKAKQKLNKSFKQGKVYIEQDKVAYNGNKIKIKLYPYVERAKRYDNRTQIIFTLPNGMDPKEINNKVWLLKQMFGENIELSGNSKTFNLVIHDKAIDKFNYSIELAKKAVEGLELPILSGMSRKGMFAYDMVKHPHLLIAGETNSGKSTQLHSVLMTLIIFFYEKIDLYLFDMKLSEFNIYEGVAKSFEYEENGVLKQLIKISKEMNNRMKLLRQHKKPNIMKLNESVRPKHILVVIDEVSELKGNTEVMEILERISAIGRALGVYLILSMQRPDREVLDGKLKHNLTVRMAFRHSNEVNSRITIDSGEAATIKNSESGKFYLSLDGLTVMQAPYLDVEKADKVLELLKSELANIQHIEEIEEVEDNLEEMEWDDYEYEG